MSDTSLSIPKDQRVPIMLTRDQLRLIDDWRRKQPDLPSRSEAIRRMIEHCLQATEKQTA